jgi:hypothetical protein
MGSSFRCEPPQPDAFSPQAVGQTSARGRKFPPFGGISVGMGTNGLNRVRCLSCGNAYVKPAGGGTVSTNPGCPVCGYVGWVPEAWPLSRGELQLRFAVGRPRRRFG